MATAANTGLPSNTAREARRRRILERGSDRLGLITGSIQSLPPDPEADQFRFSTSSPYQFADTDSSQHKDEASNPLLPNQEIEREHQQQSISDETVKPSLHNTQNGGYISSRSVSVVHDTKEESPLIPSSTQRTAQNHQSEQTQRSLLTPAQIKSAIAASENARMCCSIAAAVLVIASYMGLLVGFHYTSGIILFRPVYLLLLTNITIVLGLAFLGALRMESRTGRRTDGGNPLADQLGQVLEWGLLMQKILGAVFMDFSIYAVVLVSGLSVVQTLGW